MLWIGGDGHCAGSFAVSSYAMCEEDPNLWMRGRQPHPEDAKINWATTVANTLNIKFVNESDIRDMPVDISKKCLNFVEKNIKKHKIIVIIGFYNPQDPTLIDLSYKLKELSIRHIFFNTNDYIDFSLQNGYRPKFDTYFGEDAHQAWANVMISQLKQLEII